MRLLGPVSPYEAYADQLRRSGLDATALGRDWLRAGEEALASPAPVAVPFVESTFHAADTPSAHAYRLTLAAGRRLVVDVDVEGLEPARVFVDLFDLDDEGQPDRVASLEEAATTLAHEVRRSGDFLLRVQPELLRDVRVTVTQRTESTLRFPVEGLTARAVQSTFGAARGTSRSHEGIDIFAPRSTPVVAVADGVARRSTNNLGGNVVWLRAAGRTFYYAHLDDWAIDDTTRVAAGDVLGYVGNTGNARTTPPHLHFGIYDGSPLDPLPFVQPDDPVPPRPGTHVELLGQLVRATRVRVSLRAGPAARAAAVRQLERTTVARVTGVAGAGLRVGLPDRTTGYLDAAAVVPADSPVRRTRLDEGTPLLARPRPDAPVAAILDAPARGDVLGAFEGHTLVRIDGQATGWVSP